MILVGMGAVLCTTLFYRQIWGVNILLFSLVVSVLQFMSRKDLIRNYAWLLVSLGTFLAGIGYNFTNSWFAAILYVASMLVSVYLHQTQEGFWPIAPLYVLINLVSKPFQWLSSRKHKPEPVVDSSYVQTDESFSSDNPEQAEGFTFSPIPSEVKSSEGFNQTTSIDLEMKEPTQTFSIRPFLVPALFFIGFIMIYMVANEGFGKMMNKILEVISFSLLFFLAGSFIAMITVLDSSEISDLTHMVDYFKRSWSLSLYMPEKDWKPLFVKEKEAIISFFGLNFLLLVLLGFEITSIIFPVAGKGLAEGVHENIYAVIFSILLAACVTIYYFSGAVFFMAKIAAIRQLAYAWISLNAILALIGVYKTLNYINAYGLTYKRLSVLEYLTTIITGLVIIAFCIYFRKGNWRLVNLTIAFTYSYLILFNLPNWDRIMVRYNFTRFENHDAAYYQKLSVSGFAEYSKLENPNKPYPDPEAQSKIQKFNEMFDQCGFLSKTFEDYQIHQDLQAYSKSSK